MPAWIDKWIEPVTNRLHWPSHDAWLVFLGGALVLGFCWVISRPRIK